MGEEEGGCEKRAVAARALPAIERDCHELRCGCQRVPESWPIGDQHVVEPFNVQNRPGLDRDRYYSRLPHLSPCCTRLEKKKGDDGQRQQALPVLRELKQSSTLKAYATSTDPPFFLEVLLGRFGVR